VVRGILINYAAAGGWKPDECSEDMELSRTRGTAYPFFYVDDDNSPGYYRYGFAMNKSVVDTDGSDLSVEQMLEKLHKGAPRWRDIRISFPSIDVAAFIFQNGSVDFQHHPDSHNAYHIQLSREKFADVVDQWKGAQSLMIPPGS